MLEIRFKTLFFFKVGRVGRVTVGGRRCSVTCSKTHGFITLLTSFCFVLENILSKKGNQ